MADRSPATAPPYVQDLVAQVFTLLKRRQADLSGTTLDSTDGLRRGAEVFLLTPDEVERSLALVQRCLVRVAAGVTVQTGPRLDFFFFFCWCVCFCM